MSSARWRRAGPSLRVLGALVLLILLVHGLLLSGLTAPLQWQLASTQPARPLQTRVIAMPATTTVTAPRPSPGLQAQPVPSQADTAASPEPVLTPQRAVSEPQSMVAESALHEVTQPAPVAHASDPVVQARAWPLISPGALPSSRLMTYQLTGMDKGLTYHASGELRWQHNSLAYELTLSVRAFLVGSRQWRSSGQIDAAGLAPVRFSDSWRQERATHFDRAQQRVVFSSRSQTVALESGAQDQVSLYVQLATAMAGEPERFVPGTRLQVQTATVRDAVPWSLTLEGAEPLELQGQSLQALKWVCQPRNQYEARVEFWVTAGQAWMPVRIRITQVSGSYIDLLWRSTEGLPDLPVSEGTTTRSAPS